jgi:hypothetical protein
VLPWPAAAAEFCSAAARAMCCAFTSSTSNCPSSRFHTGFPYTPLDSIATCVTPQLRNQSLNASKSFVKVPNCRVCRRLPESPQHTGCHVLLVASARVVLRNFDNSADVLREAEGGGPCRWCTQCVAVWTFSASRRNKSAFIHSAEPQHTSFSRIFSWFVGRVGRRRVAGFE